ncbi:MAG: hypothetical protein PVG42_08970 [Lysobacterales bacterium]|jgi:hypothetical protein
MVDKDLVRAANEIKTPLAFLALAILVTESILVVLAGKAQGTNLTILVIACAALPFFLLFIFYLMFKGKTGTGVELESTQLIRKEVEKQPSGRKYDLFVSAPMAAFETDSEFKSSRAAVFDVVRGIKKHCHFQDVYYAGSEIESQKEFDSADLSVIEDFDAAINSKYFVLFYPKKLASSSLIELGWAMAYRKPIIVFYKNREDLPFLMKHMEGAYRNIRLYEYKTSANVRDKFCNHGEKLFEALEEAK